MTYTYKPKPLTDDEANLLNKIAKQTHQVSWFEITDDRKHIHDKEENEDIPLAEGICLLSQGIVFSLVDWTDKEEELFYKMCLKWGIDIS